MGERVNNVIYASSDLVLSRLFHFLIILLLLTADYVVLSQGFFVFAAEKTHGRVLDPTKIEQCSHMADPSKCNWEDYYPVSFNDTKGNERTVAVSGVTRGQSDYYNGLELDLLYRPGDLASLTENRFSAKWGLALLVSLVASFMAIAYLMSQRNNVRTRFYRTTKYLIQLLAILWLLVGGYELATAAWVQSIIRPNKIIDVKMVSMSPALLEVRVTYYYNGRYGNQTGISSLPGNSDHQQLSITKVQPLLEGEHTVVFQHQLDPFKDQPICTDFTQVAMYKYGGSNFLESQAEHQHCWEFPGDKNMNTSCEIKPAQQSK